MKIVTGNRLTEQLSTVATIKQGIKAPPTVARPPFLDTSTRVTISEAARRAAADAQARDAYLLKK